MKTLFLVLTVVFMIPSQDAFANKASRQERKAKRLERKIKRHERKGHTGKRYEKLKAKQAALNGGHSE